MAQSYKRIAGHLRFARAYAAERLPWFAPALFRCRIIVTEAVQLAAVDLHYNVYWNPRIVAEIWAKYDRPAALAQLGFVWIHEISHRLRKHGERARAAGIKGGRAARLWNIAADFEINDTEWRGLTMPPDHRGMLPTDFELPQGEFAETYYAEVLRRFPDLVADQDDGSGAHGQVRDWERGHERQRLSPLDDEVLRRDTARRIRDSGNQRMPDGWRSWAEDTLGSRVNWRQQLSHRMSVALQTGLGSRIDYSFQRPSRRQAVYHPILTPSLRGDRTARIAIVVDTSGSMGPAELQRALTEVAAVLRVFQYPVTVIPCDATPRDPVRLTAAAEAFRVNELPGGGGTDMVAGIEAALALKPRPDSVLVLTDGFTPYPATTYATPVIFGIFDLDEQSRFLPPDPPWGPDTVVAITEL